MSYKVQFLNDAEFEALQPNMGDKIGVAYPERGEAFVRQTGISVVDAFTLAHELEHLKGADLDEHYDSENRCYYKSAGDFIAPLAPLAFLIPGVGPALGGALSSIGGGVSSALGAIPGVGGALSGAASSIGSGLGSALGIGGASGAGAGASSGMAQAGQYAGNAGRMGAGQMIGGKAAYDMAPNIIKTGASSLSSALGKGSGLPNAAQQAGQGIMSIMGGGGSPMEQFMPQEQGSASPQINSQPNQIPGSSGVGSQGGPGGSPGSLGAGQVSKLKQYLNQGNFQGGLMNGPGGQ